MEPSKKKEFIRMLWKEAEAKRHESREQYKFMSLRSIDYNDREISIGAAAFNSGYIQALINVLRALEERADVIIPNQSPESADSLIKGVEQAPNRAKNSDDDDLDDGLLGVPVRV